MKESEKLAEMLKYLRAINHHYDYVTGRIADLECLQQDYLHKLEFNASEVKERNKIATALRRCRIERRQLKEQEEVLRELYQFIDKNYNIIKQLEKILGNMRKIETTQASRTYTPRVMSDKEYEGA